jgi:hypothetical protein
MCRKLRIWEHGLSLSLASIAVIVNIRYSANRSTLYYSKLQVYECNNVYSTGHDMMGSLRLTNKFELSIFSSFSSYPLDLNLFSSMSFKFLYFLLFYYLTIFKFTDSNNFSLSPFLSLSSVYSLHFRFILLYSCHFLLSLSVSFSISSYSLCFKLSSSSSSLSLSLLSISIILSLFLYLSFPMSLFS